MGEVLDRIMQHADEIREGGIEGEKLMRLSDGNAKRLRDSGVIRMLQPKEFGGLQAHPREFAETAMGIGAIDGSTGWVSGMTNAWPAECVRLFELARARDPRALALYRLLTPAFHLDTETKLVQHIKLAEHLVWGAPAAVRPPRLPLRGAEKARVTAIVRKTIAALAAPG